jgi:type IV secretory pathway TraG/TraD family ATPase VirD4
MVNHNFDLDKELISFEDQEGKVSWTIRDAVEGVSIMGSIGSGKTSGSGQFIAHKYLENGFGGLVLTAKPDEKKLWQDYCRKTGREQDLIIVEPRGEHYFNFLQYESSDDGTGKTITDNIVQVLKTIVRASEEKATGKNDDPFWENAVDLLIYNIIELVLLAYGSVTIRDIYEILQSIPKQPTEVAPEQEAAKDTAQEGQPKVQVSYYMEVFKTAEKKVNRLVAAWENALGEEAVKAMEVRDYVQAVCDAIPEARRFRYVDQFIKDNFINLNEKTRSIIDFSVSGFLFRLLQEPVYSLFCQYDSNFRPEDCYEKGKIILINLPTKEYHKVGRDAQILFKYIWQRAMEKRKVHPDSRPVFLWADEAQNFLHEYDADYQATARSSKIATVYISQNLPNYFANMGGERGRYKVLSFLGTLNTKFFHCNSDTETNSYASKLIGEGYQKDVTEARATTDGKMTVTHTISSSLKRIVRPEEFGLLLTGSKLNDYNVSGYMHVQGKRFPNGFNFKKIIFNQNK